MRHIIFFFIVFSIYKISFAENIPKNNWMDVYEKNKDKDTIERLFNLTGDFEEVELEGFNLKLKPKPIVKKVNVSGNRSFWDSEIKGLTGLREGSFFEEEYTKIIPLRIRQFYADKGYFFAKVNVNYKYEDDVVNVDIRIDEGKRAKLKNILFITDQRVSMVDENTFKKVMGLKEGEYLNFDGLQESISKLGDYLKEIGYYDNSVELVDFEEEGGGYINVFISINFGTKYIVRFDSNRYFTEEKLRTFLTFSKDGFNYYQLGLSLENIINAYFNEGFLNVSLNFNVEESEDTFENLYPVFTFINIYINEGKRFSLRNVVVDTDVENLDNDIKKILNKGIYKKTEIVDYLKDKVSNLRQDGYLTSFYMIDEDIVGEDTLDLTVKLFKNERYVLRSVKTEGYSIQNNFKLPKPYDPDYVIDLQSSFKKIIFDNGYVDGDVFLDIRMEKDDRDVFVDAVYRFELGQRYKDGFTFVYGSRFLNPKVIVKQFQKEGEFYNKSDIDRGLDRLYSSKLFDSINLYLLEDRDGKYINKAVIVHDDKRGLFQGSIGYSTDQQIKVSLLSVLKNLFNYGFEASGYVERSNFQTNYRFSFGNRLLPFNLSSFVSGFLSNQNRRYFNLQQKGYELSVDKKNNPWVTTSILFNHTNNKISETSIPTSIKDYSLNRVSLILNDDHRNSKVDTKSGYITTLKLESVFGDKTFFTSEGSGRYYISFLDKVVFSQRLFGGYKFNTIENIPLGERYFLGGISSFRGFGLEELSSDSKTGGNSFILLNSDLRLLIYPKYNLYFFTFFDIGNVYSNKKELENFALRKTTGAGVYVPSPVGGIIFDVAKKIDRRPKESPYRIELSIGASF